MTYDRTDRIRRAAILVASLDDALARQVLHGLPAVVRDRVLDEAEALEAIDPEEQQDVLAEFRRMARRGKRDAEAVEVSFSRDDDFSDSLPNGELSAPAELPQASNPGMSAGDAAAMAELLADEHPQIVAAALARLSEEQSAAVFAALPADVQAEALDRLADLAPADESAVDEVASQLQRQLQQRRERQARAAAGAQLVERILARTPAPQRTYLQARLAAKETPKPMAPSVETATRPLRSATRTPAAPMAQQALNLAAAMHNWPTEPAPSPTLLADRSAEFDSLSDDALVAGLRSADEITVLRALAASGDGLLARVNGMLPRRQTKQLKRMLGNLGPTRLTDLHAAQHQLLELAYRAVQPEEAEAA